MNSVFHSRERSRQQYRRAGEIAAGRGDVRVPEEVTHVMLLGTRLEEPTRELLAQIVEAQARDAGRDGPSPGVISIRSMTPRGSSRASAFSLSSALTGDQPEHDA